MGERQSQWTCVGTSEQLLGPQSWFVYEAQQRSLVIARDPQGALGAFVNACAHRGTRLCRGAGAGRLRCPYHGWVYETDGRLLGASRAKGLPASFRLEDHGLAPVQLEALGSFLFAADAPRQSLREALGPLAADLIELSADLGPARSCVSEELPQSAGEALAEALAVLATRGAAPSRSSPAGHGAGGASAPLPRGLAPLLRLGTGRAPRARLESWLVSPSLLVVRAWTSTRVTTFAPIGPERSLRITRRYAPGARSALADRLLADRLLGWTLGPRKR